MCPSLRSFQPTRPTDLIHLKCPLNSRVAQDRRFQQHDYTLFHSVDLAYVQILRDVPDKSHLFSGSSSRLLCQQTAPGDGTPASIVEWPIFRPTESSSRRRRMGSRRPSTVEFQ